MARHRLKAAYQKAIEEYTELGRVDVADLMLKELQEFQDSAAAKTGRSEEGLDHIGRDVWVHESGYFMRGIGKDWFEKYADGAKPPNLLTQTHRTAEFIELQNRHANVTVRIYADTVSVWDHARSTSFKPFYFGSWLDAQ